VLKMLCFVCVCYCGHMSCNVSLHSLFTPSALRAPCLLSPISTPNPDAPNLTVASHLCMRWQYRLCRSSRPSLSSLPHLQSTVRKRPVTEVAHELLELEEDWREESSKKSTTHTEASSIRMRMRGSSNSEEEQQQQQGGGGAAAARRTRRSSSSSEEEMVVVVAAVGVAVKSEDCIT